MEERKAEIREILVSEDNWCRGALARPEYTPEGIEERYCALGHVYHAHGMSFQQLKNRSNLFPNELPAKAQECLEPLLRRQGLQREIMTINDQRRSTPLRARFAKINEVCEQAGLPFRFRVLSGKKDAAQG